MSQSDATALPNPHAARQTGLFGNEHGCRCPECEAAVLKVLTGGASVEPAGRVRRLWPDEPDEMELAQS